MAHRRHSQTKDEAATTVADIEDDAALTSLGEVWLHLALLVEQVNHPQVHMGTDVAGAQLPGDQFAVGTLGWECAEVDHDRNVSECSGFDGAVHGGPIRRLPMRCLDAHNDVRIARTVAALPRIHFSGVLLRR